MTKRTVVDYASNIPDRSPAEMLEVLRKICNRDVERLHLVSKGGREFILDEADRDLLDATLDRVGKLLRATRMADDGGPDPASMTDDELRAAAKT